MFEILKALPADPILGLSAAFKADTNAKKIDLGVGVYKDEQGNTPVLKAVKQAELAYFNSESSKVYIGPPGAAGANTLLQNLIFGASHPAVTSTRVRTIQTPGGCGSLRVAAEFIKKANPPATIWVSDPTWANHIPLLGNAGLTIKTYPYYDATTRAVNFNAMMETLGTVGKGDLVLLHGCCHNPCGADLNREQWQAITELALKNGFTPFIDMAYQGFGEGLDEDAYGVRLMAEKVPELIVSSSCSKNFGLYRERAGGLSIVYQSAADADKGQSNLLSVVRGIYSMPPNHGSAIVETILASTELTNMWHDELAEMRNRIKALRALLNQKLIEKGAQQDFGFIEHQSGMFSFLGINKDQVQQLVQNYSIYLVDSSRINIAGISQANVDYLAESIVAVLKK
ncbi:aromatic amino acid transaminase [Simiduia agarivorans]|uniref:Aminotransferase n=1 Tax=Simiduia agarivorans (strain DSM 21679 / JCM 13881 / BCRC 17597 / SA1) TaxID=1117647 RepID=K4KQM8_SIMAS|nr:amino acid aminotransferase [Simiduia agarivorans]AFV00571.1 aromatic amino acid aminotransferase [Simiduia agarivorans SA1 = DSM 21679]